MLGSSERRMLPTVLCAAFSVVATSVNAIKGPGAVEAALPNRKYCGTGAGGHEERLRLLYSLLAAATGTLAHGF